MEIFQRKSTKEIAAADGRAAVSRTEANVAVIHLFGSGDWTGFCRSETPSPPPPSKHFPLLYIYLSDTRHNSLKVRGDSRESRIVTRSRPRNRLDTVSAEGAVPSSFIGGSCASVSHFVWCEKRSMLGLGRRRRRCPALLSPCCPCPLVYLSQCLSSPLFPFGQFFHPMNT